MAGNNLEAAIAMFFEQSAMGGGGAEQQIEQVQNDKPEWYNLIWPKDMGEIPESWLKQRLEFS